MSIETDQPRVTLAVWNMPSTVAAGASFSIKAGARSSADYDLRGSRIDVCSESGDVIATGVLRDAPWPGTQALAWTDLSLVAPVTCGPVTFTACWSGAGFTPAHRNGSAQFGVVVTPEPDCRVTIHVRAAESGAPIRKADLRLGPYRATTGESGDAALRLARGRHELRVWKAGFETPPRWLEVSGDLAVTVDAAIVPEENADRAWKG